MTTPYVPYDDPLSAAPQRASIDQVSRSARRDSIDVALETPPQPLIGLYELTQAMTYPDGTDPDEPDVPYSEAAKLVWLNHGDDQYGGAAHSPATTLYHPTALRDAAGVPMGTPAFGAGMRCYAWYNPQSGRWEIVAPALNVVRIELTATFMPGDGSVTAGLIDSPDEPEITAYVKAADFHGVGRVGSGPYAHAGTLGYAIFSPVRLRWELLCLQGKLISEAKADEAINTGSSGTVSLWWKEYATGNLVDSGENVVALNWLWPNVTAGDKLIVSYDRQENRWSIIGVE